MAFNRACLLSVLLVLAVAASGASAQLLQVSPTASTSTEKLLVYNSSYGLPSTLKEFTETCQLDFSYASSQPISVWLSDEDNAQALLLLPNGRPCVNQTACSASLTVNPQRRYFLLAENLSRGNAHLTINTTAAVSSPSGCGQAGPNAVSPVITDYQYVFDDSLGPIFVEITGAECISYLAVGYKSYAYKFTDTADVDGFITTLNNYFNWADTDFADGAAVQVPASECPSDVPYCTATVKGLDPSETYVVSVASGYDDTAKQSFGKVQLAYTAGSQGACDTVNVAQYFTV